MAKLNHTQLAFKLGDIYYAARESKKQKRPIVIYNGKGLPIITVSYKPVFKKAMFEITDLYGKNIKKEVQKSLDLLKESDSLGNKGLGFSNLLTKQLIW